MLALLNPILPLTQFIAAHCLLSPFHSIIPVRSSIVDPFSITAGLVGIFNAVAMLSCAVSRFRDDFNLADADLDIAQQYALLLKTEIRSLKLKKGSSLSVPHETATRYSGSSYAAVTSP